MRRETILAGAHGDLLSAQARQARETSERCRSRRRPPSWRAISANVAPRVDDHLRGRLRMRAIAVDRVPCRAQSRDDRGDDCSRGERGERRVSSVARSRRRRARNVSRSARPPCDRRPSRRFLRETSAAIRLFVACAVVSRSSMRWIVPERPRASVSTKASIFCAAIPRSPLSVTGSPTTSSSTPYDVDQLRDALEVCVAVRALDRRNRQRERLTRIGDRDADAFAADVQGHDHARGAPERAQAIGVRDRLRAAPEVVRDQLLHGASAGGVARSVAAGRCPWATPAREGSRDRRSRVREGRASARGSVRR